MQDEAVKLPSLYKDQFILIGSLILYIGLVSIDEYYSNFGIRFQFLNLSSSHIIYRGIQIVFSNYYIILLLLTIAAWQYLEEYILYERYPIYRIFRIQASYIFLLVMLFLSYFIARNTGKKMAKLDLNITTSTLPEIIDISSEEYNKYTNRNMINETVNFRLLLIDGDFVIVFKPIKNNENATYPNIVRIDKGDVKLLETNNNY